MTASPTSSAPLLQADGVHLGFGGIKALAGVSLCARAGEITAIIGPNGAGKTSLFNTVSGFYRPQQGRIVFEGRDITRIGPARRAAMGLARTFQNVALFRGMSVLDNIKLGGHSRLAANPLTAWWYLGPAQREEMALRREIEREVVDFLEIDHVRHQPVAALPYGLQKRVELARALAMRPKVLMLDEPVAGMNREETEDMARFILDIQEERGITVLLIEHDMGLVMDIANHVVVLNFGEVIGEGTPADVRHNPEVVRAYLGEQAAARQVAQA
ncbi:MAG: ABC transporter ATP-binding protein [Rubrivivax sp.]|nr:ABC transporter ATP-binding protein [Rubrivivax sp.]